MLDNSIIFLDKNSVFDLNGKVALVTGGASGIGEGISMGLSLFGVKIAIADINETKAKEVVKKICANDGNAIYIKTDISKKSSVKDMIKEVLDKYEELDIAVNCAGIKGTNLSSSEDFTENNLEKLTKTMLFGEFFCCQEEAKYMIAQKKGKIVNISSISGNIVNKGMIGIAPYCAIKAGIIHMTRALAVEWAKYNINVNSISPGYTITPITKPIFNIKERYETYMDQIPLKRLAMPNDYIGAVVFLSSDSANYITGQNLIIDGGVTLW